eukprot:TRINITY_DN1249_c0_g1_i2.p1 TRINITY_DN1249_c0_g1~~TRINITY_DN1249_c0_g1_i2.p1  ORF type:complete len:294 (-),score=59.23 TRINITY_DN1249_c0_g1_i2:170-1051(-)
MFSFGIKDALLPHISRSDLLGCSNALLLANSLATFSAMQEELFFAWVQPLFRIAENGTDAEFVYLACSTMSKMLANSEFLGKLQEQPEAVQNNLIALAAASAATISRSRTDDVWFNTDAAELLHALAEKPSLLSRALEHGVDRVLLDLLMANDPAVEETTAHALFLVAQQPHGNQALAESKAFSTLLAATEIGNSPRMKFWALGALYYLLQAEGVAEELVLARGISTICEILALADDRDVEEAAFECLAHLASVRRDWSFSVQSKLNKRMDRGSFDHLPPEWREEIVIKLNAL